MPYIAKEERNKFTYEGKVPETPGELNYLVTTLLIKYYTENGLNYDHINDILGALEGSKLEFYRRVAVKYEQQKIEENADVYE
jgi:hypothetical protein